MKNYLAPKHLIGTICCGIVTFGCVNGALADGAEASQGLDQVGADTFVAEQPGSETPRSTREVMRDSRLPPVLPGENVGGHTRVWSTAGSPSETSSTPPAPNSPPRAPVAGDSSPVQPPVSVIIDRQNSNRRNSNHSD